jgi:hypothetical protein
MPRAPNEGMDIQCRSPGTWKKDVLKFFAVLLLRHFTYLIEMKKPVEDFIKNGGIVDRAKYYETYTLYMIIIYDIHQLVLFPLTLILRSMKTVIVIYGHQFYIF